MTSRPVFRRFIKALRQRKQWLTFVGAVIVFLTFVAKEGFREQVKDIGDAVTAADEAFRRNEDMSRILSQFQRLRIGEDIVLAGMEPAKGRKNTQAIDAVLETQESLRNLRFDIESSSGLIEALPKEGGTKFKNNAVFLEHRLKQAENKAEQFRSALFERKPNDQITEADVETRLEDIGSDQISNDVENHVRTVKDEAKRQRGVYYDRYRMWTEASYFLYTLGWGLGLVGKLVGAGDTVSD